MPSLVLVGLSRLRSPLRQKGVGKAAPLSRTYRITLTFDKTHGITHAYN